MARVTRKKPPPAPPLDWLRQSVWSGEELPDELELLDAIEPERPPKDKPAGKPKRTKQPPKRNR
jgi:hypothetical protein